MVGLRLCIFRMKRGLKSVKGADFYIKDGDEGRCRKGSVVSSCDILDRVWWVERNKGMTSPAKSPLVVRQPRTPERLFVWQNARARAGPSSGELSQQSSPTQGLHFSAVPHHMDPGTRFNADAIPWSRRAKPAAHPATHVSERGSLGLGLDPCPWVGSRSRV